MVDPIADMLTRIRNAQAVSKETVEIPYSNFKYKVAEILEKNGFIGKVEKKGKKSKRFFDIVLKYNDKVPAILGLKRISKPGQRIYFDFQKIRKVKGGFGISIISTSKGLMTGKQAKKEKVGGEVICEIW